MFEILWMCAFTAPSSSTPDSLIARWVFEIAVNTGWLFIQYCAKLAGARGAVWTLEGCNAVLHHSLNHSESKSHVSRKQKSSLREADEVLKFYFKPERFSLTYKC